MICLKFNFKVRIWGSKKKFVVNVCRIWIKDKLLISLYFLIVVLYYYNIFQNEKICKLYEFVFEFFVRILVCVFNFFNYDYRIMDEMK